MILQCVNTLISCLLITSDPYFTFKCVISTHQIWSSLDVSNLGVVPLTVKVAEMEKYTECLTDKLYISSLWIHAENTKGP